MASMERGTWTVVDTSVEDTHDPVSAFDAFSYRGATANEQQWFAVVVRKNADGTYRVTLPSSQFTAKDIAIGVDGDDGTYVQFLRDDDTCKGIHMPAVEAQRLNEFA